MRPCSFNKELDLKLLQLVKDSPVLYNKLHSDFSKSDAKEEAWKNISEALGKPTAEFAGIQCQIHFGDFQEDKHKPGFLGNLNEYLPEQYSSAWGIEKKILKEYRKHQGLSHLDAKYLYTKTARAMPTYGVTFFLVKEKQKDKKKLVPRLLGINAESILRLDERTKEILQVWPLTHVKTYHAGKGETFTLNFGDYSEKEYSVKTRDAYRIRDILEGYIDIIRRRMLAPYGAAGADCGLLAEDNTAASRANVITHVVSNKPSQVIEHCIVGPTRIVPHEPGQEANTGTQIVTVQQIITTNMAGNQQTAVTSGVPLRSDMSMPFTRRLNRLNSNAVKVVSCLTEHPGDMDQARHILLAMNEDMPLVRNGVRETIEKQTTEDAKKKLEDQLQELEELMKSLNEYTSPEKLDKDESVDAAKNIADLTTRMYFSMDPRTIGRSKLVRNSRQSFIEDERTEKNIRRASFIAATAAALHTLDQAVAALQEKYTGPKLSSDQVSATEKSAVDNLAKLNAAIAHYVMAHSDPKNVDYSAAVTSMNTIHEFMPELVNDVKALASTKDEKTRKQMLADLKALCEATNKVCSTVGSEDPQIIQETSKTYTDASGKLIFAFGRGSPADKINRDKVVDLAKDVQSQAASLVKTASPLAVENSSIQAAGDHLNVAASRLVDQAELTGPTLHEPHCQSALTAAAEAVSSSAQHLSAQCRPLLEDHQHLADTLHNRAMALAQALDALKANYVNDDTDHKNLSPADRQRLKYIKSAAGAKKQMEEAEKQLNTALPSAVNSSEVETAQKRLDDRLAQLNAAMASLIAATSDRENPDYATAELAINTISELMPGIVHDSKVSSFNKDPSSRTIIMEHIKALCDATSALCQTDVHESKGSIGDAVDKFKDASGKLVYVVSHRVNPEKEQEIVQLAAEACGGTSELLCGVQQLAEDVGGEVGEQLDVHGALLADSAQQLLTLAQVTAPSISDRRCQSVLVAAADKVADCSRQLADCWTPLLRDERHAQRLQQLQQARAQLQEQLDRLRDACHAAGDDAAPTKHTSQEKKLKFMKTNAGAQQQMKKALDELNKPLPAPKPGAPPVSPQQLAQRLDALSAALAQLLQATRDAENSDYETADQAVKTISELMPQIVQDTKSASSSKDASTRAAMLEQIRALCEATNDLCQYTDGTHPQELNDAVSKFSASSGKLVFTLTPARDQNKGQQVVQLSGGACATTSELLCGVQQLAEDVGGEVGEQLDVHGALLADSAQQLLTLAQVTAPSISDRRCQSVLVAAADKVADCSRQLADCWTPLLRDERHAQRLQQLQQARAQLQEQLDRLRDACHAAGDDAAPTKHTSQEQKLKFMKTNAGAQQQMKKALDELNKPLPAPKPGAPPVSPQQLAQRLDALSAALAQLLQATRDLENPDYETAEQQIKFISELMSQIVQDTKSASASKDPSSRAAMLEHIRALGEATNALCYYSDGSHPQELNDAVSKFSASSGKLVFTLTPARDQNKGQQVVQLSGGACATTSELLCGVQQLAEDVGGEVGEQLDVHGALLADSAQQLLTLAQVTAPSISDRRCQSVLVAAADKVADCSRQLADCWTPLLRDERHAQRLQQLQQARAQLQEQLDRLRDACHAAGDDATPKKHTSQEQKLKFMKTNAGAQQQMKKALDELNKPLPAPKPGAPPVSPQQLAQRLDALSAALAQLLQATRDAENPDYGTAEQQVKIISELMPQIIQDTKSASASKNASSRAAMLEQIRALCEATNDLCQYTDGTHPQELNDAVSKFSASSGKLVFTLTPARDQNKGQQVVQLSGGACGTTSELLCGVQQLAEDVGGEVGEQLDVHGALLADSAQQLLTLAQVTAPSISDRRCQSVLVAAADKVADCSRQLADCWTPLLRDERHAQRLQQLQQARAQLQEQLDRLRDACHAAGDDAAPTKHTSQEQKLKFMKTNAGAQQQMKKALDELNKPLPAPKPGAPPVSPQQLAQRLDALSAALAQLLQATRDLESPDYETAEKQIKIISELMPQIVQDTKSESASKDPSSRADMLEHIRALGEATNAICHYSDGSHPQELNDAVSKFSASSGKLVFTLTPARDQNKEQQVVQLSGGACATTSELLCGVQQLAENVGGEVGEQLDVHGALLADSAQQLLTLAQVTAPSISDRRCQSVLVAAADKVADCSRQLADCWTPLLREERHAQRLQQLQQARAQLQEQLDRLRDACHAAGEDASSTVIQSVKLRPAVPKRHSSIGKPSERDLTKDFLETLRCEESRDAEAYQNKLKLEQEKREREEFVTTVDDVHQDILKTEQDLKQWSACPGACAVSGAARAQLQRGVQRALAHAGLTLAQLVAANYADKIDYPSASKSTAELPKLVKDIVKDGKVLSGVMKDSARQTFLNDMLQLCESTRTVCEAAKHDRQKLNQSAMVFGDNSAKLLYAVSDDVDPAVEKEIISRAKAIGDSASRLALEAAAVGGESGAAERICAAGTNAVDAAGKLVYTAKLVAPSIHEFPCQQALVTSAESVSLALEQFSESWRPLAHHDTTQHLYKEADNLNRILEGLMSDIKGGNIGKRREMEKLVIEDTPIRMLTLDIIEGAKQLSVSAELPSPLQQQYGQYWPRVSAALHPVDVAHARCNNTPHDAVKRSELEQAVQNLQMTLLTSRPNASNQNSNIVDLRDFIEEVSSEAQKLADATDGIKIDAYDKKALQAIKANCEKMSTDAYKLTHPDGETGYDTTFNDILDVDTFGQDCDEVIKEINSSLRGIQDDRVKKQLIVKMLPLTQTCNMMRFATKSGISAERCASLESTLSDLDDIEGRVIPTLVKEKADQGHVTLRVPADAGSGRVSQMTSLLSAARDVTVTSPRAPLTAYIAACAATVTDDAQRNKLLQHLYKVVRLWKLQTLSASKRLAVWQPLTDPQLAQITEQLIQEIQNPESEFSTQNTQNGVLDANDLNKLLLPGEPKVLFNTKKQNEHLAQLCTKLGSMSNAIQSSVASPQSLSRSSQETVKTACELAAIARGCKNVKDPLKSEKIEESVQQMTFATYNLLKVAEQSTADPTNANVRRRLQDACRNLNDAISRLVLNASSAAPLHRECTALWVALQSAAPAPPGPYRPPPASPHTSGAHTMSYQSATDALQEQQLVFNKMNNDQPHCRLEFAKTLNDVTGAVRRSSEYATQCAYLISISESEKEVAKKGVVNVPRIERSISNLQDSCISIIGSVDIEAAKEESSQLSGRLAEFSLCMEQAAGVCGERARGELAAVRGNVQHGGEGVQAALQLGDMDKVLSETVQFLDVLNYAYSTIDKCPLVPTAQNISKETKDQCDEVLNNSKNLVDNTLALVKDVESRDQTDTMTWTTFSTSRKKLLDAYDNLLKSIKMNGQRAGILEAPVEEEKDESEGQQKTYLETQVDIANRWLMRPMCKENVKTAGCQAVNNIIDIGRKMSEELQGSDREEMRSLVMETEELLLQCSTSRDVDKYRALSASVKEMKKLVQRGVVTRVVEELVDVGTPLQDLDILVDTEPDATKRKYILERKIAELLSQLGKVTRTARIVGFHQPDNEQLNECTKQTELLAPKLVQAAERRVNNPNDEEAIEQYKALVLEYAESIARVRELCDRSVDPMDFVQTAGDMMQRLRQESTSKADPQKAAHASQSIIRLADRTMEVSLRAAGSRSDPELRAALAAARARLHAAVPRGSRASRLHDIQTSTDEIIRTTNELESALGGENIFNKQPTEFNEKIFSVALELRESVREWSSRDNEVVGAARRMAVLMAHLSEHMHSDNKRALILTSKKIVIEAQEVAELAKKLAHECTDVRIKNNLLQTCERIPTISGQLKMLTTVKASSLGHQGTEEDKAAMDMLVGNAQSLMLSVQEVVKAAASASVKIMSQRGPRLKWVRKNYY